MKSILEKSSKTRFWLVVAADILMLACIPIWVNDASAGIGLAVLIAGLAVWHSAANWPYKQK